MFVSFLQKKHQRLFLELDITLFVVVSVKRTKCMFSILLKNWYVIVFFRDKLVISE